MQLLKEEAKQARYNLPSSNRPKGRMQKERHNLNSNHRLKEYRQPIPSTQSIC